MDDKIQVPTSSGSISEAGKPSQRNSYNTITFSESNQNIGLHGTSNSVHTQLVENRFRFQRQVAYITILTTEALERLAFYSLSGNLVLFLNMYPYRWESYNAASANFFFLGISYMTALFTGWLTDSFIGKFKMILMGFVIYISAYLFLPLLAQHNKSTVADLCGPFNYTKRNYSKIDLSADWIYSLGKQMDKTVSETEKPMSLTHSTNLFNEMCSGILFAILCFVAIGVGTVKANITPFGGDQTRSASIESRRQFFNWFYWFTNIGAFLALGPVAFIQQQISFFYGYLAGCISLVLALIVFLSGCRCYEKRPPGGSILTNVIKVLISACRSRRNIPDGFTTLHSNLLKPTCLDFAKLKYGGQYRDGVVDDVKTLLKISCVFLVLIPYWITYFQLQTTFLIQGLHMRLSFTGHSGKTQIVAAWLSLWDVLFLLIIIPIMNRFVYPRLDRAGYHFSMIKRITVGMVFGVAAMLVAGGIETRRLQIFWPNSTDPFHNASVFQHIGNDTYQAADMSVFWQIPQYALLGCSEVFTAVAGLEFAYSKAPKSMKSIIMGLFFFCMGAGSMLGMSTMKMFSNVWFFGIDHGNINCRLPCSYDHHKVCFSCHLDYYFYSLAGFLAVFIVVFVATVKMLHLRDEYESAHERLKRSISNAGDGVNTHREYRSFDSSVIG